MEENLSINKRFKTYYLKIEVILSLWVYEIRYFGEEGEEKEVGGVTVVVSKTLERLILIGRLAWKVGMVR